MKIVSILLLICSASLAHAEVFKCTDKFGKTNYQAKPCQETLKTQQLFIKADPLKEQKGKDKMKVLEAEYDAIKTGQNNADGQEIAHRNQVEQARQNAIAQQQSAGEQKPADPQNLQNQQNNPPMAVMPQPSVSP